MEELYYNRFDPARHYEKIRFRAGKGLQSAELNDLQEQFSYQLKQVANSILKEGDVVNGGALAIDVETGKTQIGKASVYLRGYVRELAEQTITIAVNGVFYIGVWLCEKVITELHDETLRDPAKETHNYKQPGASRLQVTTKWGLKDDEEEGNFYPVYRIDNGVQIIEKPPPEINSISKALARYDIDATGGNYVVDGMEVIAIGNEAATKDETAKQILSITDGKAHINGDSVMFPASLRKLYAIDPDLQSIHSEPHVFKADKSGLMRINLSFSPINNISRVEGVLEASEKITHGQFIGAADPLPHPAVLKIQSVTQAGDTFKEGVDFKLHANKIDWSLKGKEPSTGGSYNVTYHYKDRLKPIDSDDNGFSVKGVVAGQLVEVDYQWKMPRIDLVTIDNNGVVRRIKGIPHPYQYQAPHAPDGQLVLAQLQQLWLKDKLPTVTNLAVRSVSMTELQGMQEQISNLFELVAVERLRNDANAQESAAKNGVFVDAFLNNDQRDQGEKQNALINDGELVLPIDTTVTDLRQGMDMQLLEYDIEPLISQPMHTKSMAVNPYQAIDPVPPAVTLYPRADRWTETLDQWTSKTQSVFRNQRGNRTREVSRKTELVVRSYTKKERYLRARSVSFELKGFGIGEKLTKVLFDGIKVI